MNLTSIEKAAGCPQSKRHKAMPADYQARSEWFTRMARTHVNSACPGCGLWVIWTPKRKEHRR